MELGKESAEPDTRPRRRALGLLEACGCMALLFPAQRGWGSGHEVREGVSGMEAER